MHALRHAPISLATVVLAGGLHVNGQEQPSVQPDSEYTEDQAQAMDRVDKLSELLLGMPRTPAVLNALSQLGEVACRHDKEFGVRVFEKAYAVSAGMAFDLDEESSLRLLSTLVSRASNCHPAFSSRSPTGRENSPRLQPRARLSATLDAVRTNPAAATGFAHDVVESLSDLDARGQLDFATALMRLRQERPAEADAVFRHALHKVTSSGSVARLFTLGNYVFGPGESLGPGVFQFFGGCGRGQSLWLLSDPTGNPRRTGEPLRRVDQRSPCTPGSAGTRRHACIRINKAVGVLGEFARSPSGAGPVEPPGRSTGKTGPNPELVRGRGTHSSAVIRRAIART